MESPTAGSSATERECSRLLRDLQRVARAPSIAAAIARDGALTWSGSAGLTDRLDHHLPEVAHGDVALRSLLAHLSGLRREPASGPSGEIWETGWPALEHPDRPRPVGRLPRRSGS